MTYVHRMQPYGWVKMDNCRVEKRVGEYAFNFNEQKPITCEATFVVGTVIESSYCGALCCGVAMVKSDSSRYPVGSEHECRIKQGDLERGETVDVAM